MSTTTDASYDVVLVGYGPVAEVLAIMLGRQGRRVAVFERWTERYPLPRAVCIDHEIYRMLCANGLGEVLPRVSHPAPPYRWFSADWRELLHIDWSAESLSGGPEVHFVHQPTLEAAFDAEARAHPGVVLHLGCEVKSLSQSADAVELTALRRDTEETLRVQARYLIGCDGANSLVREAIGGGQEDRGFQADWLVIDLLPGEGVELDIPEAAQWCNPERPTTIVPAGVHEGRRFRRWEFMRLPHESVAELETEERAWELLQPWVKPDQAQIVRHKVYTFRSLIAHNWRDRRLLIAGDAAHVMPPFMGQGMCSGLRDAANLAWKLDLVLDGRADDALLDTYQTERAPHVSDIIDLSIYLGRMICQPDAERAAERDALFLAGEAPPPPAFPVLTAGLIAPAAPAAGLLSPHGRVRRGDRTGKFDEVVGGGSPLLLAASTQLLDALDCDARALAEALDVRQVALDGPREDSRVAEDLDGVFGSFLRGHGVEAMLVRPDFHLFGAAADASSTGELIRGFARGLKLTAGSAIAAAA